MTSQTFFFIFIPILAVILLGVNLIFAPHNLLQSMIRFFFNNGKGKKVNTHTKMTNVFWLCIYILLFLILLHIGAFSPEVVYAMDPETSEFLSKISKVQSNVEYYTDQVKLANQEFKAILSDINKTDPSNTRALEVLNMEKEGAIEAMKDSNANLASEKRMLKILQAKKDAGDFTLPTSSSTVTKRKLE